MEKRLRQKFVLVAMLSVAAALALILVVINVVNYQSVCRMADDRIEAIIQNGGSFPGVSSADGGQADQEEMSDASVVILKELSATYMIALLIWTSELPTSWTRKRRTTRVTLR